MTSIELFMSLGFKGFAFKVEEIKSKITNPQRVTAIDKAVSGLQKKIGM